MSVVARSLGAVDDELWDEDRAILLNALREQSPRTTEELLRVIDPPGTSVTLDDVVNVLEEKPGVYELPDDRWVWLPTLLDGRVFTHRVGAVELAHDVILIDVDLVTPLMLTELPGFQRLADGSPIQDVHPAVHRAALVERGVPIDDLDAEGVLLLEPGRWADLGVADGDLIALRVTDRGFDLSAVAEAPPSPMVASITAMAMAEPEQPTDLFDVVLSLCADTDELLREPSAPLGEALRAAGLVVDGDLIAAEGFDFDRARAADSLERLEEQYDLDEGEAASVAIIVRRVHDVAGMVERRLSGEDEIEHRHPDWPFVSDDPGPAGDVELEREAVSASLERLSTPEVAEAVRWELDPTDRTSSTALAVFAELAEGVAPRSSRAALRYLRGIAEERLGHIDEAERSFDAAQSLDPSWPPTLLRLAQYAADRGDAERALGLLQRAGLDSDHPSIAVLEPFLPQARPELGRNEPCWCGSGRKYKACHLHQHTQLSITDRATWLHHKATEVLPEWAGRLMVELAAIRAADTPGEDAVVTAMDDPLLADVLLAEGTQFFRFLELRGHLLPDDEREMARGWLDVGRSVHEVVSVTDSGAQLKDLQSGELHEVSRWSTGRTLRVGERYCARVLPVGDSWQIPGSLERVSPRQADDLLDLLRDEPGPVDLVRFLTRGAPTD